MEPTVRSSERLPDPALQHHPRELQPRKMSLAEKLYLPLFGGMMVTLRHLLKNIFRPKSRYTIEYPEKRREYSQRFRGHHILTSRPDGSVRCVACFLCAQACPAECIHIVPTESENPDVERYPDARSLVEGRGGWDPGLALGPAGQDPLPALAARLDIAGALGAALALPRRALAVADPEALARALVPD